MILILCDWNKAFDKIHHNGLTDALRAYGIGGNFLRTIQATFIIKFKVLGVQSFLDSDYYPQETGIRQGLRCNLSQ